MRLRIILPMESKGLRADANIFKKEFDKLDIETIISNHEDPLPKSKDDIHLYISNIKEKWLPFCKIKIMMVNHELFLQKDKEIPKIAQLDYCFCRTKIGVNWVEKAKKKHGFKYEVIYTKFTTDFPKIDVEEEYYNLILHSAGEHHWKQTDAIVKCWIDHPDLPLIIITCVGQCYKNIKNLVSGKDIPNIILFDQLIPKNDFIWLKNVCKIHLCPSIVEGYGHYINEGRKLSAFVVTSDLAPMNELINNESGYLIKCDSLERKKNGSDLCIIHSDSIYTEMKKIIDQPIDQRKLRASLAFKNFQSDETFFQFQIKKFFEKLKI